MAHCSRCLIPRTEFGGSTSSILFEACFSCGEDPSEVQEGGLFMMLSTAKINSISELVSSRASFHKSLRGIAPEDLRILKEKLEQEAAANLGMAMICTLVSSAKEWLTERFHEDTDTAEVNQDDLDKEDVIIPHGGPVTIESFLAWRERFEA